MFFDTHSHLNFQAFRKDLNEVIKKAKKAKVKTILIPGANFSSSLQAVSLAQKENCLWAAVGIHPHHLSDSPTLKNFSQLFSLDKKEKIVALGEIGLDYFQYKNSPPISKKTKEKQKELFHQQLEIAWQRKLPVIIHCRQAYDDLFSLLFLFRQEKKILGVLHCFEGEKRHLEKALALNLFLGFGGSLTFPENKSLRQIVKMTPLENILLETDAPFLTPAPFRFTRNQPAYLPYIAQEIAKIKREPLAEVAKITTENARKLFFKKSPLGK